MENNSKETEKELQADSVDIEESLNTIRDYSEKLHLKNQRRIKKGIHAILIIPWVFLIMLLTMEDSKVVYLLLWVISLFLIAAYLITVAYIDYEMHEKLNELGLKMKSEHTALIGNELNTILENVEKRH